MYRLFKGTVAEYRALHDWVARELGKPMECENCDIPANKYEWANISGEYLKDLSDWARLCTRCHRTIEKNIDDYSHLTKYGEEHHSWSGDYCRAGHKRTVENTRYRFYKNYKLAKKPGNKVSRVCRDCQKIYKLRHVSKKKESI